MKLNIAVLAGDGIGPEVVDQTIRVLDKVADKFSHEISYTKADVGGIAIDNHGDALPASTIKVCEESDAILFGSVGGPKWDNIAPEKQPERGALLPLRKHFNLFANLRPAIIYPELADASPLKSRVIGEDGLNVLTVRELTSGIYFGEPKSIDTIDGEQVGRDTLVYKESEIEKITVIAFETAMKRGKKLCSIDKANVLMSMVLWREVVERVAKNYPEVELTHMYVDNAAMQMSINPRQFDVILAGNMFGDIISDAGAAITGSLGMLASASLNDDNFGMYEPAGGSAPDIAGMNIANPIAQILSAAMMLRYSFNLSAEADAIENAIKATLKDNYRTGDIASEGSIILKTDEITNKILGYL